jgi:hypothetical protein
MALGVIWADGLWNLDIWDTAIWEQEAVPGGAAGQGRPRQGGMMVFG